MPRHLRTIISELPEEIRWYYAHLGQLIEDFPEHIALSYLFGRVEEAQNMTIYMGMRKLHRVNSDLAQKAIDRHQMKRSEFRAFYKTVIGRPLPREIQD